MIKKFLWGIDRWRIMQHPYEEWYRIKQQIQYRVIDSNWYQKNPKISKCIFVNPFPHKYSKVFLSSIVQETCENINVFQLLNVTIRNIVGNKEWNYDFKNKKKAQSAFVHSLDDFNYDLGEVKYIYELSRLYHLPILVAYAIAKNDKELMRISQQQLIDWYNQNPFLGTTAWKSGNVVGIRAINLIYYRILLDINKEYISKDTETLLNDLIGLHFKYLISHQSLYSSKGNHHIGELAGLITICATYQFKDSEVYLNKFFAELDSEILRLIHYDGFNKEQATRYQASYINLFITAISFAKARGLHLSKNSELRIQSMYDFLSNLRISKAEFFHVGDNDNAELVYPYPDTSYNIYESMLNDMVVLYSKPLQKEYHFDLRNYLLWGDQGYNAYSTQKQVAKETSSSKLYKDSGYFIIKDETVKCLMDVGPIGLLPSMCHGHSDIFSFILYINNKPIIVDCGSYQYNAHYKKYRDYFHGVHSHNTISIDNEDQAIISSGMFWLSNPNVKLLSTTIDSTPSCEAQHDGYFRNKTIHKRKLEYQKQQRNIIIKDTLTSSNTKTKKITFYLHFHPSAQVKLHGNSLNIENIRISNPLFSQGRLEIGNSQKPIGWYSSKYDSMVPSHSFILEIDFNSEVELNTIINF